MLELALEIVEVVPGLSELEVSLAQAIANPGNLVLGSGGSGRLF